MSFLRYSSRSRFLVFLAFVSAALSFVSLQQPAGPARAASSEYNVADPSPAGVSGGLAVPASCELNRVHGPWCTNRVDTGDRVYCANWSDDGDSTTWGGGNYGKSCNGVCPGSTGTIGCDGSCANVSPPPPAGYGTTCNSLANNCGKTTSGTIGCSGCTAVRPADVALGGACNSQPNNCGDTTPGNTVCSNSCPEGGTCSACKPANRVCTDGCSSNGNLCSSGNRWIWKCGCTSSPGPGWILNPSGTPAQCYNYDTGPDPTCSSCTGSSGSFCNTANNHTIDWKCGCSASPGPGWVDQNNGCFHRDTGSNCSGGGCPAGKCENSPGVCGTCPSYPQMQASCGPSRTRNSPPLGYFTDTAQWLPNGSSDWFEFNCFMGYGGRVYVFKNPIGPVPSSWTGYNFGRDPINGINLLNSGTEFYDEQRDGFGPSNMGALLDSTYYPSGNSLGYLNTWNADNIPPRDYTRIDLNSGPLTQHTTFRVICTDDYAHNVSSADCKIGVQGSNTCPSVSITAPTNGARFSNGVNITFSGTATDPDGDPMAGYEWRDGSITGSLLSTAASFSTSTLAPGLHTVYFRAKDSKNLWCCTAASVTFTVSTIGNAAPNGHITLPDGSPAGPTSVPAGTAFQLQGYGIDPDGQVKAYEWREGTLAQCQSHSGGSVLGGCQVAGNCPLNGNGSVNLSAIKPVTLPVGTHLLYFSVMDSSGPSGNNPSQLDGVWSTNCESRLLTVWDAPPPAPVLSRACFADLGTGRVKVHLGFDEAAPTTATIYNMLLNYLGNDDNPPHPPGDGWWLKASGIDDFKLFGYVGNSVDLPINHPVDPTATTITETDEYFWGAQGVNAGGLVSTMNFEGPFICNKRYLSICRNDCNSGSVVAWTAGPLGADNGGGLLTIDDTAGPQTIVACFGPNKSCSNPSQAANATVSFSNRSSALPYNTAWAKTSDAANAVTLSSNPSYGPPPDSLPFRTLTPNSVTWPGSTANFTTTLGAYILNWSVYVRKFCALDPCDPVKTGNTCSNDSYTIPSPTPGCSPPVETTCTGSRTCDFNWKEVAP